MNVFWGNNYQWLLSGILPTMITIIASIIFYKKGRVKKDKKKPEIKGKNLLSKIRRKFLTAKTLKELKEAEFELDEYKKTFPLTFEVSELAGLIKQSIRFEGKMIQSSMKKWRPIYYSKSYIITLIIIIINILVLLIWLFV